MSELIIKPRLSRRQRSIYIAAGLMGLFVVYIAFEYGRSRGGHDQLQALLDRRELREQIETLEKALAQLRAQLAAAETERLSLSRERIEVARTIGDLQSQVSRQAQELAFYRGIVAQNANAAEVKIQRVRLTSGESPRRFKLYVTLVQPVRPENVVSGGVRIAVEGLRSGRPARLELPQLRGDAAREIPFSFRYVENLATEIDIPADFRPERLNIEVHSSRRGVEPATQTLLWAPESV
ncbi:MAG: hypothetical protein NZM12_02800 [Steroidobacteraceae bacterium]|nr:hypothetical protein [Steroidobacteraceae bacterium]MDW8258784.1 hypothetical protein [Gammaproteobacteria bacterium]